MDMWMCTYDKGPQTLISYLHTKTCIYNTSNIHIYRYTINVHIIYILISTTTSFWFYTGRAWPWSSRWSDKPRVWSPVDRESLTHTSQGTRFAYDLQIVGNVDLLRLKNKNLCIMYSKFIEVLIERVTTFLGLEIQYLGKPIRFFFKVKVEHWLSGISPARIFHGNFYGPSSPSGMANLKDQLAGLSWKTLDPKNEQLKVSPKYLL